MDTIAAIATGAAPAAIGILRVSGPAARQVLRAVFIPDGGGDRELTPRRMTLGAVLDAEGRVIDHALAVWFPSYCTGEPGAELHCHGSPVVLGEALRAAFAAGARQAEPGEFSKRAFLNGRLDLTEAEAVIDLIEAESAAAARNAALQLDGALSRLVRRCYDSLIDLESRFYAVVDYPDEDIEDLTRAETERTLAEAERTLADLLAGFSRGHVLRSGAATAIIGAPNAGKSSLLNRLTGFDRAIVTEIPGTTRDTVEEKAVVGGVALRLIDTAGLRETEDTVERLGVARAKQAAASADLILAVIDASRPLTAGDRETLALARGSGRPWLLIASKCDLTFAAEELAEEPDVIRLSSVTGEGFDALSDAVARIFPVPPPDTTLLTNARQAEAAGRALTAVRAAADALSLSPDTVLTEVEAAAAALGELTGRTARDDMVSRIFERFCVGK